jgi:hypothetical protein
MKENAMKRYLVGLVALLMMTVPASASTFISMDLDQLIAESEMVVVARVVKTSYGWSERGGLIVGRNILAVQETLKGQAPAKLAVRTFGGEVGGFRVEAHGMPQLTKGEKVILFLARDEHTGTLQIVGYQQGHYREVELDSGQLLAVSQAEEGLNIVDRRGSLTERSAAGSFGLGQFKSMIQDRVQANGGQTLNK